MPPWCTRPNGAFCSGAPAPFYPTPHSQLTLLQVHRYHRNVVNKIWVTGSSFNQHPISKWRSGRGKGETWEKGKERKGRRGEEGSWSELQVLPLLRCVYCDSLLKFNDSEHRQPSVCVVMLYIYNRTRGLPGLGLDCFCLITPQCSRGCPPSTVRSPRKPSQSWGLRRRVLLRSLTSSGLLTRS